MKLQGPFRTDGIYVYGRDGIWVARAYSSTGLVKETAAVARRIAAALNLVEAEDSRRRALKKADEKLIADVRASENPTKLSEVYMAIENARETRSRAKRARTARKGRGR